MKWANGSAEIAGVTGYHHTEKAFWLLEAGVTGDPKYGNRLPTRTLVFSLCFDA